MISPELLQDI